MKHLVALTQCAIDVNTYFTCLMILWDEHKDFQPIPACWCRAMKAWMDFQQQEYVMQFLMGLNDCYTQTWAQILMLATLPPFSKVFTLVVQEEFQQYITHDTFSLFDPLTIQDSNPLATIVVAARNSKPKWTRPLYIHCSIQGHIVNKCYKLHGYPLGYKFKPKIGTSNPQINQTVSIESITSTESPQGSLTISQCQQLIALFSFQLHESTPTPIETMQLIPLPFHPLYLYISYLLHHGFYTQVQYIMFVVL